MEDLNITISILGSPPPNTIENYHLNTTDDPCYAQVKTLGDVNIRRFVNFLIPHNIQSPKLIYGGIIKINH